MNSFAEKLTVWFGSTPFIIVHFVWFSLWVLAHFLLGFDTEWSSLTVVVSLEAIFLALFILKGQNVQNQRTERNLKLDLRKSDQVIENQTAILKLLKEK